MDRYEATIAMAVAIAKGCQDMGTEAQDDFLDHLRDFALQQRKLCQDILDKQKLGQN